MKREVYTDGEIQEIIAGQHVVIEGPEDVAARLIWEQIEEGQRRAHWGAL